MFRVRILLAAVLAASALAVLAGPADAADKPSAKFCAAAAKIGSNSNGNSPTPQQAAKTYKQFKAAGKFAPAKVKAAANQIGSLLQKIAQIKPSNAGDLADLYTSSDFKKYPRAVTTFFLFQAKCGT